ncbi:exodeoxyribonuclease V subunit gamma [Candidatus Ichthyocystis hellenicum]|uniref:exodeoxyribonuclease V subunit gamma n=1 Tax=Candidatus Ichthyocystis hellenicum TaxID=1561003 RepID=UPI000B82DADC|nr:exodeoxyribonuclease V subunit gamma [Candidatus Ichthyocystis hellenicum]
MSLQVRYFNRLSDVAKDAFQSFSREFIWRRTHRFIVSSRGHADWIAYQIAKQEGICVGFSFDFPASFLWSMVSYVDKRVEEGIVKRIQAERIYRIWSELRNHCELDFFSDLDLTDVSRYHLASQVLSTLDRYDRYRPDWLVAWRSGELLSISENEHWQASLWRKLADDDFSSEILVEWIRRVGASDTSPLPVCAPKAITLFCLSSVPPLYWSAYCALSRWMDVTIWLINPCENYWGDIRDQANLTCTEIKNGKSVDYLETGNVLLAAWGRSRRDLVEWFLQHDIPTEEKFFVAANDSVVHRIQNDILTWSDEENWVPDKSLQIHRCCHFIDELHVLHLHLQKLLNEDVSLSPSDILVWVPDLVKNAGWVDAVFSSASYFIPYTITGLPRRDMADMNVAISQWLNIIHSRYEYSLVLSWIRLPIVRSSFSLTQKDWYDLEKVIYDLGVRWGLDSMHRADWAVEEYRHTWMFALDSLFNNFCYDNNDQNSHYNSYTFSIEQMGVISFLVNLLRDWPERLREKHYVLDWVVWIKDSVNKWCPPDQREIFEEICDHWDTSFFAFYKTKELVEFSFIMEMLVSSFNESLRGSVPSGSVTVTYYGGLSGLPYRFLACLGLGEGVFPRPLMKCHYDLMSISPRPGDDNCSRDDRATFLDSFMQADYVHLSYIAWGQNNYSLRVPSVLIEDIVRYLSDKLPFCNHPHPREEVERAFFYDHYSLQVQHLTKEIVSVLENKKTSITNYVSSLSNFNLDHVYRILSHPIRYFLMKIANVNPNFSYGIRRDDEPFSLSISSKKKWIMYCLMSERYFSDTKNSVDFPYGIYGEREWDILCKSVASIKDKLEVNEVPYLELAEESYELNTGCFGAIPVVDSRMVKILPKAFISDYLRFWIDHIFYCASSSPKHSSLLVTPDDVIALDVFNKNEADCYWDDLISVCHNSLTGIVPFFPKTSYEYVMKNSNLSSAYSTWNGSDWHHGERNDPYYQLVYDFGKIDALCHYQFDFYAKLIWDSYRKRLI